MVRNENGLGPARPNHFPRPNTCSRKPISCFREREREEGMETSVWEERRGAVEMHGPCHCLQTCINALLKCLGLEFDPGSAAAGRSPDGRGSRAPRRETLLVLNQPNSLSLYIYLYMLVQKLRCLRTLELTHHAWSISNAVSNHICKSILYKSIFL